MSYLICMCFVWISTYFEHSIKSSSATQSIIRRRKTASKLPIITFAIPRCIYLHRLSLLLCIANDSQALRIFALFFWLLADKMRRTSLAVLLVRFNCFFIFMYMFGVANWNFYRIFLRMNSSCDTFDIFLRRL